MKPTDPKWQRMRLQDYGQIICTLSYASRTTNGLHTMFLQDLQVKKVKVINGI